MNKKIVFYLVCIAVASSVSIVALKQTSPTIKFFPIQENATFLYANTDLKVKDTSLEWESRSKSDQTYYLRQDVSLLYFNGKLKGLRSKWEQKTDFINITEKLPITDQGVWESITFHHGEIHDGEDKKITSIQTMSNNKLYTIQMEESNIYTFQIPETMEELLIQQIIDRKSTQYLSNSWDKWIEHYQIDEAKYTRIPIVELVKFKDQALPSFSQDQTNKIIGQLWEGLYKNYVIPILDTQGSSNNSPMPIILLAKDQTHLIVLFEWNGNKEQLIQRISI